MSLRHRHLRKFSSFLPCFSSGHHYQPCRRVLNSVAYSSSPFPQQSKEINTRLSERFSVSFRHSTISKLSKDPPSGTHLLSFIESAFDQLQGSHHFWLNRVDVSKDSLKKGGTFLVGAGRFFEKVGCNSVVIFEKVKLLQQRFPSLHVIGFQDCSSICSTDDQSQLIRVIMKEYITFPILLSNKKFSQLTDEACFILSKDFKNPLVFYEKDLDLALLDKAIEELSVQYQVNNIALHSLKGSWSKEAEIYKEPQFCTALQNLLLYFPACISADEDGERLFLSDSNHHRIIIFDGDGKILDCIGSCPGFEDGEFESAKLLRPGASFYHAAEDCLYIVDSENHAVRRADLERRVLETVYPTSSINKKDTSLWTWIRTKLSFVSDADVKHEDKSQALTCPWHLIKSGDNSFLIISRSFETLWVMDFAVGEIKEVVKGFSNTLEFCRHLIMEKVSLLKKMPDHLLQQQTDNDSLEGLLYADLISCVTTFQNHIIMCDTVGQGVLKLSRESGTSSTFQFSNLKMLGLPSWQCFPLERFYASAAGLSAGQADHIQQFSLLPGKVDIRLIIDIPEDTEFVEPLHESCVWCQARGAATEALVVKGVTGSSDKVGVAQKFYDQLDNVVYGAPESEQVIEDDSATTVTISEDGRRTHIDCVVNTSPGTSEVIVYAPMYLKLRRNHVSQDDNQEKFGTRIADILNPKRIEGFGNKSCIKFLLESNRDLRDLIFIKPLHVRIKLACGNHPKADNSKGIILTDSSLNIDVSLMA